jgi:hypothetical protein
MSRDLPVGAACMVSTRFIPLIMVVIILGMFLTSIPRSALGQK